MCNVILFADEMNTHNMFHIKGPHQFFTTTEIDIEIEQR